jgi:type I restriction enzyme M protein
VIVNRAKRHPGEILLVNASNMFVKGRPKNHLTMEHVRQIAAIYHDWRVEEGISAIIANAEAARNDYTLSPSRYVSSGEQEDILPLEEAAVLLAEAEEERAKADRELEVVLTCLGIEGWRRG